MTILVLLEVAPLSSATILHDRPIGVFYIGIRAPIKSSLELLDPVYII